MSLSPVEQETVWCRGLGSIMRMYQRTGWPLAHSLCGLSYRAKPQAKGISRPAAGTKNEKIC